MAREKERLISELKMWRNAALPGIIVLILVIITRMAGGLQALEWMLLDTFLCLRPSEAIDERVVIIGITEDDIEKAGSYPIPDGKIADLLNKLQSYKPRAIGLDLFKNVPVAPGREQLAQVFRDNSNIFAIEKFLKPAISKPDFVPQERVGIADIHPDKDGKNRRYILMTPDREDYQNPEKDRYSLGFKLAEYYLKKEGFTVGTGKKDPDTIRFKNIELPRVGDNFGSYVETMTGELQVLVNFRSGKKPFQIFSLYEIVNGKTKKGEKINPDWLRDKIILVGNVAPSLGDSLNTLAVPNQDIPGQIYGVEYHAHAISQIINAVLNERPLIKSWSEISEYCWIIIWGIAPIAIGRFTQSIRKNLLGIMIVSVCAIASGYLSLLYLGVWVPWVPSLITLAYSVGLSAFAFYQHDRAMRKQIELHQRTIEHTFNLIHNGPLQTLASGLQQLRKQPEPDTKLIDKFERLNSEIREIGEHLRVESLTNNESLRLGSGVKIDLNRHLHDLFYEVYSTTLEREDLEFLKTLKVKMRTFEPINDKYLNIELKRELCLFLEECLCNVGKHALGVKCVEASGICLNDEYLLRIQDDGSGLTALGENKGTKQAQNLARRLNGNFRRETVKPRGIICELTWKLNVKK
jgi:CHASE2 domain-containing sensor protein